MVSILYIQLITWYFQKSFDDVTHCSFFFLVLAVLFDSCVQNLQ